MAVDREAQLAHLREKIKKLDEKLLLEAAKRLEIAREIGALKLAAGMAIKDYRVEKEVLERAEVHAAALGVYPSLASDLAKLMMRYSVAAQDAQVRASRQHRLGPTKKILIAGGAGRMGRWLSEYFESFGHEIVHFDHQPDAAPAGWPMAPDLELAAQSAEVVILSTPISATAPLIDRLAASKTKALVFDICSLKAPIIASLQAAARQGLAIASAHPMFGPRADVLAGRNILICRVRDAAAATATRQLFEGTTAHLWDLDIEKHDELMSYVLGLSHLTNLLFARVLATSGVAAAELRHAGSTTYDAQLGVSSDVSSENPDLYFEIQAENSCTGKVLDGIRKALSEYAAVIETRDRTGFRDLMESGRSYLDRSLPER